MTPELTPDFRIITAAFIDPDQAVRAIGALQDHGIHAKQISVLSPGHHHDDIAAHETPIFLDHDGFMEVQTDDPPTPTDMNAVTEARRGSSTSYTRPESPIAADGERGITVTTAADAARGAAGGSLWGLGLGVLAGLAALTVPGVGPVLAAGPLWLALTGAAGATAAGAVAGGIAGYLEDQGVPSETAIRHADALRTGSVVVTVHLHPNDNASLLSATLAKYGGGIITAP